MRREIIGKIKKRGCPEATMRRNKFAAPMCAAGVRFPSMRVDNFRVSAQQDRKSAEEASERASGQANKRADRVVSSLGLLRAPRLGKKTKRRASFLFQ